MVGQEELDDSPLFRTAISDSRKKVPSRGHPGRTAVLLPGSDDDHDDGDGDGDELDAMSKSMAGQWMQAAEAAYQRESSGASTGDTSEASDWRDSLMGSEPNSPAGEGDVVLSPAPRIGSSDVSGVAGDD